MSLNSHFFSVAILLILNGTMKAQNIGINATPIYTLDVHSSEEKVNSTLNLSNPLGTEFLRLMAPNSTNPEPGIIWKEGMTLNFYLTDPNLNNLKNYLKFDGRGIALFNTGESIFIGEGAGRVDDLISNHNVGIGHLAMFDNTSGVSNVALGSGALRFNINGNDNVVLGRNAAHMNDSGNFNVVVGHSALFNNISGERNTVVGTHAGQGTGNTNFSGNVLLGYEAGKNETNSDRLYINNTGSANPLIYGEFDNSLLKINGKAEITRHLNLGESIDVPQEGDIQYNPEKKDFEGFNGTEWLSLTKGKQDDWGYATGLLAEKYSAIPSDGANGDLFGASVDISGDYAIVGAPGSSNGKAYIFHYVDRCWVEEAIITDPNGASGDSFGASVAISGDYIIVGAPLSDYDNGTDSGKALIFHRSGVNWNHLSTIEGDNVRTDDYFGSDVDIDGDYAVVGVPGDQFTIANQGSIYIFYNFYGDWTNAPKRYLIAPDATPPAGDGLFPDAFGSSVAIDGDKVVVGAPGRNGFDTNSMTIIESEGSVYLFQRGVDWTIWNNVPLGFDHNNSEYIGSEVGICGNKLMFTHSFGSSGSENISFLDGNGPGGWNNSQPPKRTLPYFPAVACSGDYFLAGNRIFEYVNGDYQVMANLTTTDEQATPFDFLGNESVSISGEKIIVGNSNYSSGANTGKVYFYSK